MGLIYAMKVCPRAPCIDDIIQVLSPKVINASLGRAECLLMVCHTEIWCCSPLSMLPVKAWRSVSWTALRFSCPRCPEGWALALPSKHVRNHFRGYSGVGKGTSESANEIVDTRVHHLCGGILNFLAPNRPSVCTSGLSLQQRGPRKIWRQSNRRGPGGGAGWGPKGTSASWISSPVYKL